MNITIIPGMLRGEVTAIPSKSQAHRLLICAAFADRPTILLCRDTNQDIEATADCLRALGASIDRTQEGYAVTPCSRIPEAAVLPCRESGSTLRFLLPVAGALGIDATFQLEGRLPQRPLSPLWEEMERMGCILTRPTENTLRCQGQLRSGEYTIAGNVSSQFISGLLFAHNLMEGCHLTVKGKLESKPYVDMTKAAIALFQGHDRRSPGTITVEGDWSNGAFWLCAAALGSDLKVLGLAADSMQGDRAVAGLLPQLCSGFTRISAADIPDLIPVLAVVAGAKHGAVFTDIGRLRLKESDRVASTVALLEALGGKAEATDDTLTVYATGYIGGTVDACGDHRIAMSAAVAATVCSQPVTVLGAEAVNKSYPHFWAEYRRLGGKI